MRRLAWKAGATALAGERLKRPWTQRGEDALRDWRGMLDMKATLKDLPVTQGELRWVTSSVLRPCILTRWGCTRDAKSDREISVCVESFTVSWVIPGPYTPHRPWVQDMASNTNGRDSVTAFGLGWEWALGFSRLVASPKILNLTTGRKLFEWNIIRGKPSLKGCKPQNHP